MKIFLEKIKTLIIGTVDENDAYKAGFDCSIRGPDENNCHHKFFRSKSLTKAWETGKLAGEMVKKNTIEPDESNTQRKFYGWSQDRLRVAGEK